MTGFWRLWRTLLPPDSMGIAMEDPTRLLVRAAVPAARKLNAEPQTQKPYTEAVTWNLNTEAVRGT